MSESYIEIEKRISVACDAYSARGKTKIMPLSREFHVPYGRLLSRIKGRDSRSTRPITNRALDEAQEQLVIQWIISLDNTNASPTPKMIEQYANQMLSRSGQVVGKTWVYRFIKHLPPHLNLRLIKKKTKESKCMQPEDLGTIQRHYDCLDLLIKQHKLHPKNIYNFDESGFSSSEGKKQNVITANPSVNTHILTKR